ncbi:MAG: DUF1772 domain-containing protein [Chloroflexi bacterium]|jgi:hypothetical protein|nr:DUF1772 domain-containing protein [Chloroflexota bacterium]
MKLKAAQFINTFLLFLVAGVFWGTWFSLARSMRSITPGTFLEVGKIMIRNLGLPMSILLPAALLSTLPVLFWLYQQKSMLAFSLTLCGFMLFVIALLITLLVNVPIDNQITQWTVQSLPAGWETIRDRWEFFHTLRTLASAAGLGFVIGAVLVRDKDEAV